MATLMKFKLEKIICFGLSSRRKPTDGGTIKLLNLATCFLSNLIIKHVTGYNDVCLKKYALGILLELKTLRHIYKIENKSRSDGINYSVPPLPVVFPEIEKKKKNHIQLKLSSRKRKAEVLYDSNE